MKEIAYFTKRNKTIANEHYFYLSPNKEDTFDNSKVGKRQMGEYIIEEYIDKTTFWYLPIYVSDTEIHLMTKDDAVIKLKRKRWGFYSETIVFYWNLDLTHDSTTIKQIMKKTTVLTILLAVLACSKGTNEQDVSFDSYEIKEPEIKGAIVDYRDMIVSDCKKEIQQGDSLYVGVTVKYINDSITRYVIYPIHHYESLRYVAPFFICNVDGHDAFINIIGGHSSNYTVNSSLEMREQNFRQLI